MIGPVFFVLLETSIRKGARAGLAFDIGVLMSDIIYILIAYLFFSEVKDLAEGESKGTAQLIGGILFIGYGVVSFFKKPKNIQVGNTGGPNINSWKDYFLLTLKGFLLNMANPLVIFYWFSVLTLGDSKGNPEENGMHMLVFISIILVTFFSVDILKIFGAKQLRPLVNNRLLKALNQLIGIVFVVFGVFLVIDGLYWNKL